jgi:hypothetical protein
MATFDVLLEGYNGEEFNEGMYGGEEPLQISTPSEVSYPLDEEEFEDEEEEEEVIRPVARNRRPPKSTDRSSGASIGGEENLIINTQHMGPSGMEADCFFCVVVGGTRTGKTTLVNSLIKANHTKFEHIYAFSKTLSRHTLPYNSKKDKPIFPNMNSRDPRYPKALKDWENMDNLIRRQKAATPYGFLRNGCVFDNCNEENVKALVDYQDGRIDRGEITPLGPDGVILIILDDIIGSVDPKSKFYENMCTSGRHSKVSFILVSQKITGAIAPAIRVNCHHVFSTMLMGNEKTAFTELQTRFSKTTKTEAYFGELLKKKLLLENESGHKEYLYIRSFREVGTLVPFTIQPPNLWTMKPLR